jgi:LPS O-antigen subunit length determinant protein (WzzB/FepE family)
MNIKNTQNIIVEDEIDLIGLFKFLWKKKFFIMVFTFIFCLLTIIYSLTIPNIYESKSLLAPSSVDNAFSSKINNIAPVGSFSLGSLPNENMQKSNEGMARIKSYEFFVNFILPNIKIENLMAVQDWNPQNNTITYNNKLFDAVNNQWIYDEASSSILPSSQKAFSSYKKLINMSIENKTSFIKISVKHQSPHIAKKWLDLIIYQINESMRVADEEEAKRSIDYLNNFQKSTNIQSMKEATSSLLEKQMQTLMLTSANEYYVFKILDSPIVPENKSEPSRLLIVILGLFIGLLSSLAILVVQNFKQKIDNG